MLNAIYSCAIYLVAMSLSSCSAGIYASGRHSDILVPGTSRTAIRAEIGKPVETGTTDAQTKTLFPNSSFDRFVTRGPVYDKYLTTGAAMSTAMTVGLLDLANYPRALVWKASSRGQCNVTVYYTPELTYRWHEVSKPAQMMNDQQ